MKILVFSDSHGSFSNIRKAIDSHRGSIDAVIHLGDGTKDMDILREMHPEYMYCCVSGNYEDSTSSFSNRSTIVHETLLDFEGKKFFITHGHKYDVKYGYERLVRHAEAKGADIALFGHTHIAESISLPAKNENEKPLKLFNPGTVSLMNPSYGVIHIVNGVIVTSFGKF